jgi:hypothetical protein
MKTKIILHTKLLVTALMALLMSGCNGDKKDETAVTKQTDGDTSKKQVVLPVMLKIRTDAYLEMHGLATPDHTVSPDPPVAVPPAQGKIIIEATTASLTLNGHTINLLAAEIDRDDLDTFKGWADALTGTVTPCDEPMAGIRILYAQRGSSLSLYYQPVKLCNVGEPYTKDGNKVCDFDLCKDGSIYYYSGDFNRVDTQAETDTMNARIARYKKLEAGGSPYGVKIRNRNTGDWEDFNTNNGTANVESIVYPVEELTNLAPAGGKVRLWNAVIVADIDNVFYHKHNIELSTGDVDEIDHALTIPGSAKFSNLSHICPPRCSGRNFTIHIK